MSYICQWDFCYKHCYHQKPCASCLNSDKGKPEHCRKCKIKECIKIKELSYCFECSEYPCKQIKDLEKSYNNRYQTSLMENSEFVRQFGLEKFMDMQKEKYICSQCGGIISIHDRECSECQEKMKYWRFWFHPPKPKIQYSKGQTIRDRRL